MCGICGVLSLDAAPIEPAVRRAMRAMVHRGPDDEGFERLPLTEDPDGPACGFGFRRLAIMDLSPLGHQPMLNRRTGDAIVFNGEIYNFADLRRTLQQLGHEFRSTGDTEVLLHALSQWGDDALGMLDGMFALAFYQASTRRVLLARDPLGIKPLYVARMPGTLIFGSEVRTLLATGLVPSDLDPAGVASYLAYGAPQDPLTVHRFIRSMPAATAEWIDAGTLSDSPRPRRYWRFPAPDMTAGETDAVARVRAELTRSVRRQLVSDVPLAVFLSGGIDSATMAALARSSGKRPMTFVVGYELPGAADETAAAAETAEFLGTRHFQTILDNDWVQLQLYEWLKAADRPSIDGLNTYIVSGAVKDAGATVALSGLGADELFGGYSNFRRIPKLQRIMTALAYVPSSLRRAAARTMLVGLPADKKAKAVDLACRGSSAVELAVFGRRLHDDTAVRSLGFDPRRCGMTGDYLPPEAYEPLDAVPADVFRVVSEVETSLYMRNTLLRDSDVNSMAHSLEIRVPFLGQRLVDYACSLPGSVRGPKSEPGKYLLRKAVADLLPPSVFERPKSGFSLPFGDWIFGPLRDQSEAAVDALANCTLFDGKEVRRRWNEYGTRRREWHWSRPLSFVVLGNYLAKCRAAGTT